MKIRKNFTILIISIACGTLNCAAQNQYRFQNYNLTFEERVNDLVSDLTYLTPSVWKRNGLKKWGKKKIEMMKQF
jgi:hypothetical protein